MEIIKIIKSSYYFFFINCKIKKEKLKYFMIYWN